MQKCLEPLPTKAKIADRQRFPDCSGRRVVSFQGDFAAKYVMALNANDILFPFGMSTTPDLASYFKKEAAVGAAR